MDMYKNAVTWLPRPLLIFFDMVPAMVHRTIAIIAAVVPGSAI